MAVHASSVPITVKPIQFGTDGWRGIIAADFTFERVARVAAAVAEVLAEVDTEGRDRKIVVGFDRRFLSESFAKTAAEAVQAQGFDVLLAETYAPTPAFSWAAHHLNALGAIVITASLFKTRF